MDDQERAAPPEPPSLIDGEEHPVDPRTVRIGRLVGLSVVLPIALVPLTIITIGWAVGGIPGKIYLVLLSLMLVLLSSALLLVLKLPAARYRHLRYLVHEGGLRIRRGVLWRRVIWIPITRVQHTDFSQGPVERKYGLATLTVHTAGTTGASISLPGLEYELASRLCDHLRQGRESDGD